jgi:RimJ/RimL family protein N-acetyltransferase
MLCRAFGHWACKRVALLTGARKLALRQAIMRIGAREEGTLRSHRVMRDGFARHSVMHNITQHD